jgi:hypothetical protein
MPDKGRLVRAHLSEEERELRSRLAQLITGYGFVRGGLVHREKTCGRPNCRCARGERHHAVALVASEGAKLQQLHIPAALEATAAEWVETYHRIRELLEELSQRQWEKLRRREP